MLFQVALLPAGADWFVFNATDSLQGGQTVRRTNLSLGEFPVYVRAGSIAPLAATPVQPSAAPGGLLAVQVYAGGDAPFALVADDGITTAGAARRTRWAWSAAGRPPTWRVSGPAAFAGGNDFTSLRVALFVANAPAVARSTVHTIGRGGSIKM